MYKIFLAIGNVTLENYLKQQQAFIEKFKKTPIKFIGETVYKGGIITGIEDFHPDVIVINENLSGNENLIDIICTIRINYPDIRVIYIGGKREIGDATLATLVQYGVYDIIVGDKVAIQDIVRKIIVPTKFGDVACLLPKISVDEKTKKKIFEPSNIPAMQQSNNNENDVLPVSPIKKQNSKIKKLQKVSSSDEETTSPSNINPTEENENIVSESDDFTDAIEQKENDEPINISSSETKNDNEDEIIVIDEDDIELVDDTNTKEKEEEDIIIIEDDISSKDEESIINNIEETVETEIAQNIKSEQEDSKDFLNELNKEGLNFKQKEIEEEDSVKKEVNINPIIEDKPINKEKQRKIGIPIIKGKKEVEKEPAPIHPIKNAQKNNSIEDTPKDERVSRAEKPLKFDKDEPSERTSFSKNGGLFSKIFNKNSQQRLEKQILTFTGGSSGVGNSQLAFNTAITMAEKGYKIIYLDLNDRFSSVDYLFQLGFKDVGIDTALLGIAENDLNLIANSIVTPDRLLLDSSHPFYKRYMSLPRTLHYMFFSDDYMTRDYNETIIRQGGEDKEIKYENIKDLIMYLMMKESYDLVILDAPSDIYNKLTETALIYSSKVFFTLTQDFSVIGNHINNIKIMNKKRINFREKFYYLLNKYENASYSVRTIYEDLTESLRVDGFDIIVIPNINRDFINANYNGTPIIWQNKSKEVVKAFSLIQNIIMQ